MLILLSEVVEVDVALSIELESEEEEDVVLLINTSPGRGHRPGVKQYVAPS